MYFNLNNLLVIKVEDLKPGVHGYNIYIKVNNLNHLILNLLGCFRGKRNCKKI